MTKLPNLNGRQAFDDVVDQYWDEILAYLWRMFSGAPEAEDCFQETFLRAFQAYPDLDDDTNVRGWLYRIATNVSMTHFKRNHRRGEREKLSAAPFLASSDPTHEKVQQHLLLDRVVAMVNKLPEKQRAAFMLRKYQGCTYSEIAEALECTGEAARANVYQALRKLKAGVAKSKVGQQ